MNKDMLEHILSTQSVSGYTAAMNATIIHWIERLGGTWTEDNGNIYGIKGESTAFPCMVAHTDTVHRIVKSKRYRIACVEGKYFAYDPKTRRYTGIGGDDKVGIFIALEAFARFDNIKVAFFRDEEIGCRGASVADMNFFNDVGYAFECDRQGYGDFINQIYSYELFGEEFLGEILPILETYGYKTQEGALTDVYRLKRNGLGVCVANMSCGYYKPHTPNEYIDVEDMTKTLNMVLELIDTLGERKFEHQGRDMWEHYLDGRNLTGWGTWYDDEDFGTGYTYRNVGNNNWVKVYNSPSQSQQPTRRSTVLPQKPLTVAGRSAHECPTCGNYTFWLTKAGLPDCPRCEVDDILGEHAKAQYERSYAD